jgi:hypothetical protein
LLVPSLAERGVDAGAFEFDGYLDGALAQPAGEQTRITVEAGKPFPGIGGAGKPCRWRRAGR